MEDLLKPFEYITDAADKVDELIEQARKTRGHKEKQTILNQAQALANAFQKHCEAGGNMTKQFKSII